MVLCPFSLHLHHFPLDSTVVDVTEILCILLHTLSDGVGHDWCEAALVLLKLLVVHHLMDTVSTALRNFTTKPCETSETSGISVNVR